MNSIDLRVLVGLAIFLWFFTFLTSVHLIDFVFFQKFKAIRGPMDPEESWFYAFKGKYYYGQEKWKLMRSYLLVFIFMLIVSVQITMNIAKIFIFP